MCTRPPRSTAASAARTTTARSAPLMLRNIREAWIRSMVQRRDDVVLIDAAVLGPPQIWEASGHLANFTDPLVDCTNCKNRFRLDKLDDPNTCPSCGKQGTFTEPRQFNLMFKTHAGPVEDAGAVAYLRPETAQGMFVNFSNVLNSTRRKPPFGIAQVGKSFRNEITPQNWIFRTREFEQMEMEYFVPPADGREVVRVLVHRADELVLRSRCPVRDAAPPCPRRRRVVALLDGHVRRRVPVPVGMGRGRGHRPAHRLRPHPAFRSTPARSSTTSTRRPTSATSPYVIEPAVGVTRLFADLPARRLRRGRRQRRDAHGAAPAPATRAVQGRRAAAVEEGHADAAGPRGAQDAQRALHGRLRRDAGDRSPVPPPGRDRHAVVRHGRLRLARRRRRDDPRSRHDRAGAGADRFAARSVSSTLGF